MRATFERAERALIIEPDLVFPVIANVNVRCPVIRNGQ
jgi:hypothetical protein